MRFNRPRGERVLRNSPSAVNQHFAGWPPPDKFYKRKSQEKHFANDRIFSDFPARLNERGWFWFSAPWTRSSAQPATAVWIFTPSGFHRVVATKPVRSETNKQNGCQVPTMVLIWNDPSTTSNCFLLSSSPCELRGSAQHSLVVYSHESQSLKSFPPCQHL